MGLAAIEVADFIFRWFVPLRCRDRWCREIRRIKIIFAGNPDQREQGITPGIGQGRAHSMWCSRLADRTDWPIRRNPFSRGMCQNCAESYDADTLVYRGGLHSRDLMVA